MVSSGFITAWGPYALVSLYSNFYGELLLPVWITPAPVLFAKFSIAFNPFVYIFFTARYRNDFASQVRRWSSRIKQLNQGENVAVRDDVENTLQRGNDSMSFKDQMDNNPDENSDSSSAATKQHTIITCTATPQNTHTIIQLEDFSVKQYKETQV